ncbi:MAG TPA: DnaA/Hda family protein [Stellaceae bacterium]|nr:DnaA/Hda family protein [Stellaceae bacterium]
MAQLPLDLGHLPALGREDFLVAPSNESAVKWLERWPDWPRPALALHGPPGSGKTHLAHVFTTRARAAGIITAFIEPATLDVATVPSRLGDAGAVVVDDANRAPEQALLHLHNLVAERRGHLLVVAAEPPSRWPIALADLRSRLLAAPAVAVNAPDDALLSAVLVKLFADRQVTVAADVIGYLVARIERSFAAARAAVAALDAAALAEKHAITAPFARRVLKL